MTDAVKRLDPDEFRVAIRHWETECADCGHKRLHHTARIGTGVPAPCRYQITTAYRAIGGNERRFCGCELFVEPGVIEQLGELAP